MASAAIVGKPLPDWFVKYRRLLWVVDAACVAVAVGSTFQLLFRRGAHLAGVLLLDYAWLIPTLVVGWMALLAAVESRNREVTGSGLEEYRRVIKASLYLFGILAVTSYLLESQLSRALFVTTLPLGTTLLLGGRWLARKVLHRARGEGRALTNALIIGDAEPVRDVLDQLRKNPDAGYRPAGLHLTRASGATVEWAGDVPLLDRPAFDKALNVGAVGAVIVAEGLQREETRRLAWRMENRPVELMFVPRLVDVAGPRLSVRQAETLSLMYVDLPRFTGAKLVLKRTFDIVVSAIALVLLAPVFLVIAVMIKLDGGGPVLFRQERVGRYGQPFTIHKFRTMCVDAEAKIGELIAASGGGALLFKLEDDPRITKVGRFLRKYSLDELPQFWTALRGGMSVVGPRPQVSREVAEYTDIHHRRLLIKPGITGLWQVNGRSELSMEDSIRLDLRYVENWSLIGDITIILRTVGVVLRPSGAF